MLSPARPSSSSLRNISTPVTIVLVVSLIPMISISSPTLTIPRSTRPVTTVPRPEMVNTSSTGIRNGLSISRFGSGTKLSSAAISAMIDGSPSSPASPSSALSADAAHDRGLVARVLVLRQQLAQLQLHQVQQLRVFLGHHVHLVQVDDDRRHADLASQQDVLARLRHRAVRRRHHQDRPVHLGRPGDHVLDVVGVTRAIDVRVVTVVRLVLHVGDRDRDAALALFRRLVDLVVGQELRPALLRQHLGDRRGQRGLAVVDVADRPHVQVRLVPYEFLFGHESSSSRRLEPGLRWTR